MANESADFARDLGYLDKFLTGLSAHAGTIGGARGQRLKQLMVEETARWAEIKGLLAGQEPAPQAVAPSATVPVAEAAANTAPRPGFTVGSLLGQKK